MLWDMFPTRAITLSVIILLLVFYHVFGHKSLKGRRIWDMLLIYL